MIEQNSVANLTYYLDGQKVATKASFLSRIGTTILHFQIILLFLCIFLKIIV